MADIKTKIGEIYSLERFAANDTIIHRLHPLCKLVTTLVFIVTVVSFERHELGRLLPYAFYPAIIAAVSETPHTMLLKRTAAALPFCLFIGLSNVFFEHGTAFFIGGAAVSSGIVSFAVILYRTYLCVTAVLILMAVTPFAALTAQLRSVKLPETFIVMLEITYRYIGALFDETASMRVAYALRNPKTKGVDIRHAGSFAGCLLIRSFNRAERIYAAMKCRGYPSAHIRAVKRPLRVSDIVYCASLCALCLLLRFLDIGRIFAPLMGRT